jgi:hypothetical protein
MIEGGLTLILIVLSGAFVFLKLQVAAIERKLDRLSRLEAKVDALLEHDGVTFNPFQKVPPGVEEALRAGRMIDAIKQYREATGADLAVAKRVIDELQQRARAST